MEPLAFVSFEVNDTDQGGDVYTELYQEIVSNQVLQHVV